MEVETAMDDDDFIHVVFTPYSLSPWDFRIAYLKVDANTGKVAVPPTVLPSLDESVGPDIVVDSEGHPHITFYTYPGPERPGKMTYLELNATGGVVTEQELPIPELSYYRDMATDSLERIYLLWWDTEYIHYHMLSKEGDLIVNDSTEAPEGYDLILDRTQYDIHVLEEGYSSSDFDWSLSPVEYDILTTTDGRGLLIRSGTGHDFHETDIIDADRNIHFFLRADDMPPLEDNYLLHHYKARPDGEILIRNNALTPGIRFPIHPSAELDSKGNIHVIWWGEKRTSEVFYVKLTEEGKKAFSPYPITEETGPSSLSFLSDPLVVISMFVGAAVVVTVAVHFTLIRRRRNDNEEQD